VKETFVNRPTTVAEYVNILRRRKWIIVALPVMAAVSAFLIAQQQSPVYQASAQILVNRSSIVSAITQVSDPSVGDPTRFLSTQAEIARSPVLAARVVAAADVPGVTASSLLANSTVNPEADADFLDVTLKWPVPDEAVRLTNAYARQLTAYKTELDTKRINTALASLRARLAGLRAARQATSPSYGTLVNYELQLQTIGTLLANNTSVLKPADFAGKIRPRPQRTAILGGLLGLVLGLAFALVAEALDRRVRSDEELEVVLGVPLMGRVPPPPRHLSDSNTLVTLAAPESVEAESFRKLKTAIDFLTLDRAARTIMVTSAIPGEGKSTTAANLAIAFARTGRKVALVDLDLRRPSLHKFFQRSAGLGITDVILRGEPIGRALRAVPLSVAPVSRVEGFVANGSGARDIDILGVNSHGSLSLLPAGGALVGGSDPLVNLLEGDALNSVFDEFAGQFDLVIVDTPPLLAVGDAMALTAKVDAVALVLHAQIQRPALHELARELQSSQAPVLGFIVTGTRQGDGYDRQAYGYGEYAPPAARRATRRAERV
jgi:polysaccharide biosynthesis transport protein